MQIYCCILNNSKYLQLFLLVTQDATRYLLIDYLKITQFHCKYVIINVLSFSYAVLFARVVK